MGMIITVDGLVRDARPSNGGSFNLKECQQVVDGYIEIVNLKPDMVMVINEEGKFTKAPNSVATMIARAHNAIFPNDYIAGNCLICKNEEVK